MPNSTPVRFTSGVSTDPSYGPLGAFGLPNPFMYHVVADDFDSNMAAADWTKTVNANGTVATSAADGGKILFTTNSSTPLATDICSIQKPFASFGYVAGYKMHFLTRLNIADATNTDVLTGLIQTTTTPFTVVDGIYFFKAAGATTLILRSTVGSANTDLAIPSALYPVSAVSIDLGFEVTRKGDVIAYVGGQMVGFVNQSERVAGQVAGAVARSTGPTLTAVLLNPTLAIRSGAAASTTMTSDFILASKER